MVSIDVGEVWYSVSIRCKWKYGILPPIDGVAVDVSVHEGVEAHAQHDDVEGVQQPDVDHLQRQQYYH